MILVLRFADSQRGWRHVDPIVEAYVNFLTTQVTPTVTEHGLAFVAWAISLGHLRRITYEANDRTGEWDEISNRLERWSPSEQVFPTSDSMRGFLECAEWKQLFDKWTAKFAQDGGANESGVSVAKGTEGAKRKAELKVDLEVSLSHFGRRAAADPDALHRAALSYGSTQRSGLVEILRPASSGSADGGA